MIPSLRLTNAFYTLGSQRRARCIEEGYGDCRGKGPPVKDGAVGRVQRCYWATLHMSPSLPFSLSPRPLSRGQCSSFRSYQNTARRDISPNSCPASDSFEGTTPDSYWRVVLKVVIRGMLSGFSVYFAEGESVFGSMGRLHLTSFAKLSPSKASHFRTSIDG